MKLKNLQLRNTFWTVRSIRAETIMTDQVTEIGRGFAMCSGYVDAVHLA